MLRALRLSQSQCSLTKQRNSTSPATLLSKSNENELRRNLPIVLTKEISPNFRQNVGNTWLSQMKYRRNVGNISPGETKFRHNSGDILLKSNKISHRQKFSQMKFRGHEKSPTKYLKSVYVPATKTCVCLRVKFQDEICISYFCLQCNKPKPVPSLLGRFESREKKKKQTSESEFESL